ncbi:MAG: hypothetical protein K1X67_21570 [Fimbriimonadaceae bacterium]|nr:hypothetical protein [Fimbriimonadaceae bacterium]
MSAVALLLSAACLLAPQSGTRLHKGPNFDIRYPSEFKVRKGRTDDSYYFTSRDKSVEFFVFSPLWNGDPSEIFLNAKTEKVLSETRETKKMIVVYRATYGAKDESYKRSVEDVENKEYNTRYTFGYKYRDQKAFEKYRKAYLAFKKSLKQYAD